MSNRSTFRVEVRRNTYQYTNELQGYPDPVRIALCGRPTSYEQFLRQRPLDIGPLGFNHIMLCGGEYLKPHAESAPWTFNPALEQNDYTPVNVREIFRIVRARNG
jgi:hypothetical protein